MMPDTLTCQCLWCERRQGLSKMASMGTNRGSIQRHCHGSITLLGLGDYGRGTGRVPVKCLRGLDKQGLSKDTDIAYVIGP